VVERESQAQISKPALRTGLLIPNAFLFNRLKGKSGGSLN
jgi:hypothetical protein